MLANGFVLEKPRLKDIPEMRNLVMPEVQSGIILDRSEDEMACAIRSYSVIRVNLDSLNPSAPDSNNTLNSQDSNKIIAFSALHIHSINLGEVRSLIVAKDFRKMGLASALILSLINEARALNLKEVLTLTYAKEVFEKMGFREIAKEALPNHKVWTDCVKCTRFPICDEIALLKIL